MNGWQQEFLRGIPPVNEVLDTPEGRRLLAHYRRERVTEAVAEALAGLRAAIRGGNGPRPSPPLDRSAAALAAAAGRLLADQERPRLRRVINATGVVLHTNLGRAPLAAAALAQVAAVAAGYSNLELDLNTGERGSRYSHVAELLCRLTGAEDALVVNNNASAVLLMLTALCQGREVPVSRGELVEIGGSFRVPEVMAAGGAHLVEVGTTNKTHRRDYEQAIGPATGAILKVHTSNYRIVGFTAAVGVAELADVAHGAGLPLLVDWGSGVLVDLAPLGVTDEAPVSQLLVQGADLVTFSGDKLLGGPQAGFIVGRADLIRRLAAHPLTRALRIDKLTLAGIEATLRLYLDPEQAWREVPALRMLRLQPADLAPVADRLAGLCTAAAGDQARVTVLPGQSQAGGGALPEVELPTVLVAVEPVAGAVHEVEARLRAHDPPVLARIARNQILFDPRTLWPDELEPVAAALGQALTAGARQRR